MKKIFTKTKLTFGVMLLALTLAVVINMKYSGTKYLGDAAFVNADTTQEYVETSAKVTTDYITEQREQRDKTYKDTEESLQDMVKSADLSDEDKQAALSSITQLSQNKINQQNIESVLCAKNFNNALVIIGEQSITVMVQKEELSSAETLIIKDAVVSVINTDNKEIKIVAVNS